jgi:hypothetical protein
MRLAFLVVLLLAPPVLAQVTNDRLVVPGERVG